MFFGLNCSFQAMSEKPSIPDADDIFGMTVAITLKKLKNAKNVMLRYDIYQLLFKYEIENSDDEW